MLHKFSYFTKCTQVLENSLTDAAIYKEEALHAVTTD